MCVHGHDQQTAMPKSNVSASWLNSLSSALYSKREKPKAPSTPAKTSKQYCRMLQVERFFRQSRTLLRRCCRFSNNVAVFNNNVEWNFVLSTKSKQIKHVQLVATLSKGRYFYDKLIRHCCCFWQQSRMLLRHCCWCGRGFIRHNKWCTRDHAVILECIYTRLLGFGCTNQ